MTQTQNWNATFFLRVNYRGEIIPSVSFDPIYYEPLSYLFGFSGFYTNKEVLSFIEYVSSKLELGGFTYEADDAAEFIFNDILVEVKPLLMDFEAFTVNKKDFFIFLYAWACFLEDYEKARIPLIIPEVLKDTLTIKRKIDLNLPDAPHRGRDNEAIWVSTSPNIIQERIQSSSIFFSYISFSIFVFVDGTQLPHLGINKWQFPKLAAFFTDKLSIKADAISLFGKLRSLPSGEKIVIEALEQILVTFTHSEVWITVLGGEYKPYGIPMVYFLKLLDDWILFLDFYERGQIPGLIPSNLKDEWCIIEKTT
ncbi:MAG: hypothetical protein J0L99_08770 [Chitinophagales bacterium]|nr:hypothetical protein [Chitinophagales bacterium]